MLYVIITTEQNFRDIKILPVRTGRENFLQVKISRYYRKGTNFCVRFIYANYASQAQVA